MQNMQYVEYVEYDEYAWYEEYVEYDEYDEYAWYDKYVKYAHTPLEYEPPCFNITNITNMQINMQNMNPPHFHMQKNIKYEKYA
jgi:hypothetical protein